MSNGKSPRVSRVSPRILMREALVRQLTTSKHLKVIIKKKKVSEVAVARKKSVKGHQILSSSGERTARHTERPLSRAFPRPLRESVPSASISTWPIPRSWVETGPSLCFAKRRSISGPVLFSLFPLAILFLVAFFEVARTPRILSSWPWAILSSLLDSPRSSPLSLACRQPSCPPARTSKLLGWPGVEHLEIEYLVSATKLLAIRASTTRGHLAKVRAAVLGRCTESSTPTAAPMSHY